MADPATVSQYYRKKLEQHELTPEEWSAVRFAVIKHTLIAAATTLTLGTSAFFYARSRSWSRAKSLSLATGGNLVGLSVGAAIAMESGMKTIEDRLQGSGSELLYLMNRYSKAVMKERLGDRADESSQYEADGSKQGVIAPRMIRIQDPEQK
ncbi:hypothetical protein BGZ80_005197 [Entomortierella chlamydospora]|uniref:Uncharacterized protein n=1 Tax=Entomortierella chlamydospora TaxID=101097 RepID=A0A9P6T2U7_9FUNG|nr:hypothetical protein BGZ80_005197 [Entomortierella chlamydospora]